MKFLRWIRTIIGVIALVSFSIIMLAILLVTGYHIVMGIVQNPFYAVLFIAGLALFLFAIMDDLEDAASTNFLTGIIGFIVYTEFDNLLRLTKNNVGQAWICLILISVSIAYVLKLGSRLFFIFYTARQEGKSFWDYFIRR